MSDSGEVVISRDDELSALEAARQLQIDLNRLYVLLRLGRLAGRKVNGEWRVCARSVEERLRKRLATHATLVPGPGEQRTM